MASYRRVRTDRLVQPGLPARPRADRGLDLSAGSSLQRTMARGVGCRPLLRVLELRARGAQLIPLPAGLRPTSAALLPRTPRAPGPTPLLAAPPWPGHRRSGDRTVLHLNRGARDDHDLPRCGHSCLAPLRLASPPRRQPLRHRHPGDRSRDKHRGARLPTGDDLARTGKGLGPRDPHAAGLPGRPPRATVPHRRPVDRPCACDVDRGTLRLSQLGELLVSRHPPRPCPRRRHGGSVPAAVGARHRHQRCGGLHHESGWRTGHRWAACLYARHHRHRDLVAWSTHRVAPAPRKRDPLTIRHVHRARERLGSCCCP